MAKTDSYTLVRAAQPQTRYTPTGRPWSPGFWTQLPLSGLLTLLVGFVCATAALTIALLSDEKPLDYWTVGTYALQPTVMIAVLTTLANALLGYAFTSGIAIYWWTSTMAGRSLHHLHALQSQAASLTGWDVACTESSQAYRLMNFDEQYQYIMSTNPDSNTTYSGPEYIQTMFNDSTVYNAHGLVDSDLLSDLSHYINISTLYKATPGGNGTLTHRNCIPSEALVRYSIEIVNDTLALRPAPRTLNRTLHLITRPYEQTGLGSTCLRNQKAQTFLKTDPDYRFSIHTRQHLAQPSSSVSIACAGLQTWPVASDNNDRHYIKHIRSIAVRGS